MDPLRRRGRWRTEADGEFEALLREALGRPGVGKLMEVYGRYEEIVPQIDECRKAIAAQLIVKTSGHTGCCEDKIETRALV